MNGHFYKRRLGEYCEAKVWLITWHVQLVHGRDHPPVPRWPFADGSIIAERDGRLCAVRAGAEAQRLRRIRAIRRLRRHRLRVWWGRSGLRRAVRWFWQEVVMAEEMVPWA